MELIPPSILFLPSFTIRSGKISQLSCRESLSFPILYNRKDKQPILFEILHSKVLLDAFFLSTYQML